MKLEDQVCSFELAKRLKELGVKQDSHFYWQGDGDGTNPFLGSLDDDLTKYHLKDADTFSAFTVAELGERLPHSTESGRYAPDNRWMCRSSDAPKKLTFSEIEADARAKMLTYLLENELVKPDVLGEGK